jgi:hypothetical protein
MYILQFERQYHGIWIKQQQSFGNKNSATKYKRILESDPRYRYIFLLNSKKDADLIWNNCDMILK